MSTTYGIIYGAEGSPDFHIDAPYNSINAAREELDCEVAAEKGGAAIIEVTPCTVDEIDAEWGPGAEIESLDHQVAAALLRWAADADSPADDLQAARELMDWTITEMGERLGLPVQDGERCGRCRAGWAESAPPDGSPARRSRRWPIGFRSNLPRQPRHPPG